MEAEDLKRRSDSRREIRAALIVVMVAGVLRAILFIGVRYNDEFEYGRFAHLMAKGDFRFNESVYSNRVGILAPTALFYALFGVSNFSSCLWGELCALGMVLLAYLFGKKAHSLEAGVAAGLFAATFPLNLADSSSLYGDIPSSFFMALCFYLVWRRHSSLIFVASGLALGCAQLCKEASFFALPVIILYAYLRREKRVLWVVLGFVAIVLAEMAMYAVATGHPFFRYQVSSAGHHRAAIEDLYSAPGTILHRLFVDLIRMWFWPLDSQFPFFGVMMYLFAAACILLWRRGKLRSGGFFMAWWAVTAILINFWPLRPWPYLPGFMLFSRVLEPLVVPTAVILGVSLFELSRRVRIFAAAGTCAISIALASGIVLYYREWTRGLFATHQAILAERPRTVYCDTYSSFYLKFWNRYEPSYQIKLLEETRDVSDHGSLVIRHEHYLEHVRLRDRLPVPELVNSPPSNWEVLRIDHRRDTLRAWRGRLLGLNPDLIKSDYTITLFRIP